jgi:hypothetical protein
MPGDSPGRAGAAEPGRRASGKRIHASTLLDRPGRALHHRPESGAGGGMMGSERRQSMIGRWGPVAFYGLIVLGWLGEGMRAGADDRLWLAVLTLPVPALYLWRTRRGGL